LMACLSLWFTNSTFFPSKYDTYDFLIKKIHFFLEIWQLWTISFPQKNPSNEPQLLFLGVVKWEKDCHQKKNAEIYNEVMLWWDLLRRSNNECFFSHFISSILCLYFHYSFGLISFDSGFTTQMWLVNKLFCSI
jgi:hypothetical protein